MTNLVFRRARDGDAGRGLARMNHTLMQRIGLAPGDTVELVARRTSCARVVPADIPEREIHLPSLVERNVGVKEGAELRVRAIPLAPLAEVCLKTRDARLIASHEMRDALFDMPLCVGDRVVVPRPTGPAFEAEVEGLAPEERGHVTDTTTVSLTLDEMETDSPRSLGYEGVGGLRHEFERVHDLVTALSRPELFAHFGIDAPRGILLSGPPGTGKTLLARALAEKAHASFLTIAGPELLSKHYGESEAALRRVFQSAARQAPAIIFIDELDAIAPKRDDLSGDKQVERRIVAQLLTLMDGLNERGRVIVMAATNQPDAIDPALRRPGRFDREVVFSPPDTDARYEILRVHFARSPLESNVDLEAIARAAHGYVGADLAALAREAAMAALKRVAALKPEAAGTEAPAWKITMSDIEHGLSVTSPSVLRGVGTGADHATFEDIAGMADVKARLARAIVPPRFEGKTLSRFGVRACKGILLTGPPGTGKTLMARAIAQESGFNFIHVRPTDVLSRHFGEAEREVARLFARARATTPAILFFDEFDAIARTRGGRDAVIDRLIAQFLVELDGAALSDGTCVLAATNRAQAIDPALLRPGRFDEVIAFPMPDAAARTEILRLHLSRRPLAPDIDLKGLADRLPRASGADLAQIVARAARDAAFREIEEGTETSVSQADLERNAAAWTRERQNAEYDFLEHTNAGGPDAS